MFHSGGMRAIKASRFGGPQVLELVELPEPAVGAGELRVEVRVIGVGWLDTLIRRGRGPAVFAVEPPYIPGSAVAGTVTAVGDGVDPGRLGTPVVAHAASGGYGGGYVDTLIATPETAFPVPAGLDLRSAMAVLDDGSTALALLERTPVREGERVLVAPGLGGLGNLLVQLLRAAGATVIAGVRGAEKLAMARKLGVEAVDYSTPDWPDHVRAIIGGRRLDVVFDGLGGAVGASSVTLLADGGRFSGYGMTSGAPTMIGELDRQRLTIADMGQLVEFWADAPRRTRHVLRETADGRLTPIVGQTYSLADAAAAHADFEERRVTGKSLLLT